MIKRIDFRPTLVAILFSVLLSILVFPLLHTILHFFTNIKLDPPMWAYWLEVYLPLILAGIYIGFAAKVRVFISGAIVGIIYNLAHDLFSIVLKGSIASIGWLSVTYGPIRDGLLCGLLAWATFQSFKRGLKNRTGNV